MESVKPGHRVLVVWGSCVPSENLKAVVDDANKIVGDSGKVAVENAERLTMGAHPTSVFDVILSGLAQPQSIIHSSDVLSELVRIMKPNGVMLLREPTVNSSESPCGLRTPEKLVTMLKINGLVSISNPSVVSMTDDDLKAIQDSLKTQEEVKVVQVHCNKPDFEVGSSSVLTFVQQARTEAVASVWKLDDTVDDSIDIIDSEQLLGEEDLKKPDAASLKVCGTTGKRKACKNCSCGLAEELAGEGQVQDQSTTKTSSCGSCYLGDAFRCASCPYLGMPAFKPGEKIQLTDRQLKADA